MLKRRIRAILPSPQKISNMKFMRLFGKRASNPLLWYINRRSVSRAVLIGTFFGILPIPFHSILIAIVIITCEASLPIGLMMAWINNPLTIIPIMYVGFWLGSKVYGVSMINKDMILGVLHQIEHWIRNFGHGHVDLSLAKILVTGLVIEAVVCSVLFYILTQWVWRLSIVKQWEAKKAQQQDEVVQ